MQVEAILAVEEENRPRNLLEFIRPFSELCPEYLARNFELLIFTLRVIKQEPFFKKTLLVAIS